MRTIWKTPEYFASFLPPIPACDTIVRAHYQDIAELPFHPKMPAGAWKDTAWMTGDSKWRGTPDMQAAINLARHGWPQGAETASKLHDGLQHVIPQQRRLAQYAVAGQVPSVARYIAGNPAFMKRVTLAETPRMPIVTLVVNAASNCDTSAARMMDHAAATAGIVDYLESGRYRVELVTLVLTHEGQFTTEIAVMIKRAQDSLSLATAAYALGHAAFFRRLIFAVWSADSDYKPLGDWLGSSFSAKPDTDRGAYVLPSAQDVDADNAATRFWSLLDSLRKQGCPAVPPA